MHWQDKKIILAGGAGLVGQNLVAQLRARGYRNLVVLDKHRANLAVLRQWQPQVQAEYADLAQAGEWQRHVEGAAALVMLQAQIGGTLETEFTRNSITSTRLILALLKHYPNVQLIHIS
ncbi:NAD-dependent epimerase/dehydratase family protein, partial [Undibacterium sp. CCC1.1]